MTRNRSNTANSNSSNNTIVQTMENPHQEPRIDKYGGTKDDIRIQTWLKIYELHTSTQDGPTKAKNLIYALKGTALEWFGDEIATSTLPHWSTIKERMITRFGTSSAAPLIDAQRRYLKRDETVETYYQEKIRLLRQTDLSEQEIVQQLTEGLPISWKLTLTASNPVNASAWINVARMCESHFKLAATRKHQFEKKTTRTLVATPSHHQSGHQSNFRRSGSFNSKPPAPCRHCQRLGKREFHWHKDCPNKPEQNQSTTLTAETDDNNDVTLTASRGPIFKFINIPVRINGTIQTAFIDTGSSISIISDKLCRSLGLRLNTKNPIVINQVEGVTRSLGHVDVIINIHSISKPARFHVLKQFNYPVLIGLDIGRQFNIKLDLREKKAVMTNNNKHSTLLMMESSKKNELAQLLKSFKPVFAQNETDIGRISVAKHHITTVNHPPIQLRAYRRPQSEYDEISRQIRELKEKGLIRDSESPWAFPVTLVKKKDGDFRLCIDYRRLNSITIDDKMPLPRINDVIDRLQGSKYFTTLDVAWGYWHIEVDPESIEKTAFITHEGHYEWMVMPFGLKNAPATFQRIIQRVLGPLLYNGAINYLDDIIIYSETFEEHIDLLSKVLDKLKLNNIKLKLSKCHFVKTEVEYLGYMIGPYGVKPCERKVKAVYEFPTPYNLKTLRQFLGLANYYRRFIHNFAVISKPLTTLLKKNQPFNWNLQQEEAFSTLKRALTQPPVISIYNKDKPCTLYTDASAIGIGATLAQIDDEGLEHPIAYFSKTLNEHQANYTAFELECLAVVEAVEHFEVYLSLPFKVITDHSALRWLLSLKKPKGRLYRWSIRLSTLTYELIHRAGKNQQHVDALSRSPVTLHLDIEDLKKHQQNIDTTEIQKPIIKDGIMMVKCRNRTKIVVPKELKMELLQKYHDNHSHPGKNKTVKLITQFYWWPDAIQEIRQYVSSCKTCQLVKVNHQPKIGQMILPSAELEPGDLIGLDTIVLGPAAGSTRHKYIQVFIDHFSRFVWAFPTKSNTSESITTLIDKLMHTGIRIKCILTDCHKNFNSKSMKLCLKRHNIKQIRSTPYHPQTNGIVERLNGTLITKLRAAIQDNPRRKWNTLLPDVVKNYNNTPHDITGYSPNYLFFGNDNYPSLITNNDDLHAARQRAKERTRKAQEKRKERHDAKHPESDFFVGQRVLREIADNHPSVTKISPKFTGPYYITAKITDVTFEIAETLSGPTYRAHASQLKPFVERQQTQ